MSTINSGVTTIAITGIHSRFKPGDTITRSDIDAALFDSLVDRAVIVAGIEDAGKAETPAPALPRKRK